MIRFKIISVAVLIMVFAIANYAFATTDLKVTKFTVTPSSFGKGQSVGFSMEIENPTNSTLSRVGDIYLYVRDGTPERERGGGFLGSTPIPSIPPRSKITVTLTPRYTVPRNAGDEITFTVNIPSIIPGTEFGQWFQYKFNALCRYNPEIRFLPIGPPIEYMDHLRGIFKK